MDKSPDTRYTDDVGALSRFRLKTVSAPCYTSFSAAHSPQSSVFFLLVSQPSLFAFLPYSYTIISFLPSFLCLLISFLHSLLPSLLLFRPLFCTAIPYIYCICSDEVCVGYNDSRSSSLRARPAASQRAQSKVLCWICTHRTIQDSSSSSVIVIVVLE